jgi:hypothetical protein
VAVCFYWCRKRVPGENYWPVASCWQTLSHNVVSSTPCHERDSNSQHYWWYALIAQVVRKSNYHYDHDGPLNWNKVFFMKCRFNLVQMKIPWSIDNKHIWKVYRNFSSNFVAVLRQRKKMLFYTMALLSFHCFCPSVDRMVLNFEHNVQVSSQEALRCKNGCFWYLYMESLFSSDFNKLFLMNALQINS